jgi:hypothetical protein
LGWPRSWLRVWNLINILVIGEFYQLGLGAQQHPRIIIPSYTNDVPKHLQLFLWFIITPEDRDPTK